ncbi:MAG: PSD1 and planctomycete cytochrome C domain-containing protein, partial [Pirellulales bacterium]
VKPLLESRCYKCHGPKQVRDKKAVAGKLLLVSRGALLKGGETGPAIVPGKPADSLLVDAVNWGDLEMPPKSKLPAGEIAVLTRWIEMGAPWPDGDAAVTSAAKIFPLADRKAKHWSWRDVKKPAIPAVKDKQWPHADHDYFILRALEAKGLAPAPPADRRTILRRAYFDLIGVPPTPEQVKSFLEDSRPTDEAFGDAIDGLLALPHFGERWGRHWLDLVRYAESRGHEFDHTAANAFQYRDYVIRALNADVPYDQFVIEHLAGDLCAAPRLHPEKGHNESVLGTGFWYLGDWVHSPVSVRRDEMDRIDNMIDTIGRTFLGLTIACARCHDHKFDAISTADYYALAGFAQSSQYRQVRFESIEHNRQVAEELWTLREQQKGAIRKTLASKITPALDESGSYYANARRVIRGVTSAADAALQGKLSPDRLNAWIAQLQAAQKDPAHPLHAWGMLAADKALTTAGAIDAFGRSLAERWRGELEKTDEALAKARIVVDYGDPTEPFIQDGYSFGPSPALPGQLTIVREGEVAKFGVHTQGAARRDMRWDGLKLAGGTQNEPGAVGKVPRSGQTLRTPTFSITDGTIHYLIRGAGTLQAVVGSHRLIAGPLHGNLVRSFDTKGQLQWIGHGLGRYKGQRGHLEIAPKPGSQLDVFMVADSGTRPPNPTGVNRVVCDALASGPLEPALTAILKDSCEKLGAGAIPKDARARDYARIADWMLGHLELFFDVPGEATRDVQAIAHSLNEAEMKLAAQIQKESRTAISIWDGSAENEHILIRGNSKTPGPIIKRRFLEALGGRETPAAKHGSGRLQLAKQFVDSDSNPFTSRVIVNRLWHHLYGRGIVPSVDNFGVLGQLPSHPELLDHLAIRFVEDGWSIKKMIRNLMLSSTYQMSSKPQNLQAEQADPENILLHRARVRRLQAEVIRDTILAVSGRLDHTLEGPSVPVYLTRFMTGRGRPGSGPLDGGGRRSIYTSIRRNFLPPMMLAFDMPIPFNPVGRRNVSNVPAQPLILMNDPFVAEQAKIWAKRVMSDDSDNAAKRITTMYETAFGRPATTLEIREGTAFLQEQSAAYGAGGEAWKKDERAWADFGHVLWNVKEFIFIN